MKKKKICMLFAYPFTYDNRAYRQAKALFEEGYEVVLISPKADQDLPNEETIDGIKIKRPLRWWLPFFPLNKNEWLECKKYYQAALNEEAEIYHCSNVDTLPYGYLISNKIKSKFVYDSREYWRGVVWGGGFPLIKRIIFRLYIIISETLLARKASVVMTVNEMIAKMMKRKLMLSNLPLVVMNVPNSSKKTSNELRSVMGIKKDDRLIVYSGTFGRDRAVSNVILAVKELPDNVYLSIIGYGLDKSKYIDIIKKNNLEKRVKILPPKKYKDLIPYISSADIGIIPTIGSGYSSKFALPNKFFEYCMAGLAIASTNLPYLEMMINKHEVGLTFDAKDPISISFTVNKLLGNKKGLEKFRQNSKKVSDFYNWEREKKIFTGAYKNI